MDYAEMWRRLCHHGLVTGAWISTGWEELPWEVQKEFIDALAPAEWEIDHLEALLDLD